MPTATPAAFARPTNTTSQANTASQARRIGRLGVVAMALAAALSIGLGSAEAPIATANAGPSCSSHSSLTRPPTYIRVLRVHSGRVTRVPFRKYVVTVMGKEWPSYLPQPVIEAGAVAVKQYGWYHAVFSSRSAGGRCFDVKDSTGDQLYKPDRSRVRADHHRALDKTWNTTLRKDGRFFMTGYRRGEKVRCGKDHTGYKLYARSAIQCARNGYGWQQILRRYYGPNLELVGGGASSSRVVVTAQPSRVVVADRSRPSNSTASANSRAGRTPSTSTDARNQVVSSGAAVGGLAGGVGAALAAAEPLVL